MRKGKTFMLVGGVFGLVGLVLLGVGVALAVSTLSFLGSAQRTDGSVVALEERTSTSRREGRVRHSTNHYPVVEFTVDGRKYEFESSIGSDPPAHDVGETVPVAYNPDDPSDARIASTGSTFLLPLIFGGIGIIFTPVGVALLVKGRRIEKQRAWLLEHGREVWAEIADIGFDFNVRINGRHPYVVNATWHDETTGRTYMATSDYFRRDPGPGLRGQTHVRVLYDPADPERNVLDLTARR